MRNHAHRLNPSSQVLRGSCSHPGVPWESIALANPFCPSAHVGQSLRGRGEKEHIAWVVPGEHNGVNPHSCQVYLFHHSPRTAAQGSQLGALRVSSKPLPSPASTHLYPSPHLHPHPCAAPRSTDMSGLSCALACAKPFTSLSGFLPSQGRFLHRPEMCEGVGRARVCGQDHQHQEAVCSR